MPRSKRTCPLHASRCTPVLALPKPRDSSLWATHHFAGTVLRLELSLSRRLAGSHWKGCSKKGCSAQCSISAAPATTHCQCPTWKLPRTHATQMWPWQVLAPTDEECASGAVKCSWRKGNKIEAKKVCSCQRSVTERQVWFASGSPNFSKTWSVRSRD